MNVLVVDEEVPYPLNTGKRLRPYNLVRRLQERHSITYLCYGDGLENLPDCPNVNLKLVKSPILEQKGARFHLALLRNIASPLPYVVVRHRSVAMLNAATAVVENEGVDLIHCEWTPYTANLETLLSRKPSVLSAHNVEAKIWERYHQTETNPLKKAYIGLQWQKLVAYERIACKGYTEVAAVSEPDKEQFAIEYGCSNVTVVPNGVDESYFSPVKSAQRPGSMVFTGSMDWRPNQDGVRYFIEEVFPLIRRQMSGATFVVVGRKPPAWLVELASDVPGVTVTGTVDDVRPYIAEAALYVVPLRVGGGSRLKILEALAMEKPVLSTTVGAEGLDVREGKNILLRDDASSFADAAVQMLSAPDQYAYLGVSGRRLIKDKYTWDAIASVMEGVWLRAAGRNV